MKVTTVRIRENMFLEVKRLAKELGVDNSTLLSEALFIGLKELRIRLALDKYAEGGVSFGRATEIAFDLLKLRK